MRNGEKALKFEFFNLKDEECVLEREVLGGGGGGGKKKKGRKNKGGDKGGGDKDKGKDTGILIFFDNKSLCLFEGIHYQAKTRTSPCPRPALRGTL